MGVTIVSRCKARGLATARVGRDARRLLQLLQEEGAELTVSLVGDAVIRSLNRDARGIDRPTDVLAWAMREGVRAPGDAGVLGDVVISVETAARQAHRRGVPTADEVRTLLIHGVLHLLGYDHERSAAAAHRMRIMERRLRAALSAPPGRRAPTPRAKP